MKNAFIAIIVLLALVIGGGIFWHLSQRSVVVADPIDAIPISAAMIISYPEITKAWDAFESQDYYEVFAPIQELELFFARNLLLDSLVRYDQDLKVMLDNSVIWSSYHPTETDSLQVFHVIKPNTGKDQRVLRAVNNALRSQGVVTEHSYRDISIFKLVVSKPYNILYYTVDQGLILSSSSLGLLKQSLAQLNAGNTLKKDPEFVNAVMAAGKNVEANILLKYDRLPSYLSRVLKPTLSSSSNEAIGRFASWTELDVNLKPEGITLNGFSYISDSLIQILGLFLDQQPQPINFPEFLPSSTASFLFFGIDDVMTFTSDYRKLLRSTGNLRHAEKKLDSLNAYYGVDLEQHLLAWVGNSFGVCVIEPKEQSFASSTYMIFEARSPDLAIKLLEDLSVLLAEKNEIDIESEEVGGITIRQLPLSGILTEILGGGFEAYENPFYMVVKNHVIFGTSIESLASYLQHLQGDRTLAKELAFSRFAENLGSSFNVFSYHHLAHSRSIFESYLNRDAVSVLENNRQLTEHFEAIGTQISTTGKSFYSNVFVKYNPNWSESSESNLEAKLDSKPSGSPVFVKNHLNGQNEILIQDDENALYLFNEAGQRLFKAELSEAIRSRPVQVDALRNGKLQYLFNTKNYIYLIDRNGKNVSGYPIELNSPAETHLAVFDYDKDRNYRLLIACKNKHIYNYDINGKKINGWRHSKASDPTIHPFKHLSVSGKDYLITGESNGKIHLLDRRGKNRVKVQKRVTPSKNNHLQAFRSSENAFTGIYITDVDGKIHRVSLSGEVSPMDLGKFSPEHRFIVADLNKDGGPEFIFSDLNMLQIFNYKKEKVAEQRLDPSATAPFLIDLGEKGMGIGYCFKDSEQLVLFDSSGSMMEGFPLSGSSEFDILQKGNMLTVSSAGTDSNLIIQAVR